MYQASMSIFYLKKLLKNLDALPLTFLNFYVDNVFKK